MIRPYNVIITGVGGQGVSFITHLLGEMAVDAGIFFKGTVFKGGAQRMGSVYSELRFFFDPSDDMHTSAQQIGKGEMDLLVGMELWESLRFVDYCHVDTVLLLNSYVENFFQERNPGFERKDPMERIAQLQYKTEIDDYGLRAEEEFGSKIMANYLMARQALTIIEPLSHGKLTGAALEDTFQRHKARREA